jgi:AcrR family transcriptional regulator
MRATKTKTGVRQEQIAQSALTLIARNGFHRLSLAAVAREVGVVPSAIYRHYQGKDNVLDAVLELISRRLLQNVELAREKSTNALERLHDLLLSHMRLVQNGVPIPRVVFSEEIFTGHRKRRKRVHQIFQQYLGKVAEMVVEGQRAGEIRGEFDPETLSIMFLGLVQPSAILWLISEGEFNFNRHVQNAWLLYSRMIRTTIRTKHLPLLREKTITHN